MTTSLQTAPTDTQTHRERTRVVLLVLTLALAGRAMTLAFIGDVGGSSPSDPPDAWLMPLIGDAVVGLAALPVAYLVARGRGTTAWTAIVVWNAIGIWDALSAWLVNEQTPWPDFFMLELFGESMFFAASATHGLALVILFRPATRARVFATDE